MRWITTSLRGRIVLASALSALVVLIGVGGLVLVGARKDERIALDGRLQRRAQALARPAALARLESTGTPVGGVGGAVLPGSDTGVRVITAGVVTRQLGAVPTGAPLSIPRKPGLRTVMSQGRGALRSATVRGRGAGARTLVEVIAPLSGVDDTVARLRRRVILVGLAGLLVAIALASVAAGYASRALGRLRDTTGAVADTERLDLRVPEEGPEEVKAVAVALNAMLVRLERSAGEREQALEATRRFAADAGHELRTPLAVLQAGLETLQRNPDLPAADRQAIVSDTLAEHQRLSRLVVALQALTRGDGGPMGDEQPLDLMTVVEAAASAVRREYLEIELSVDGPAELPTIAASPAGMRLLLDNVLQNAARHGRADPGSAATIRVAATADERAITITVDDDGPGIPAADRARVVERFARGADPAAEGSGLGLAIAAQQAQRAGGTLTIGSSPSGGARLQLVLPA